MLDVKTGNGFGLRLTLRYASGIKVQLAGSKYLSAILRLPAGTTQQCSSVTFDEISNDIYIKLAPAELSVVGNYGITVNVQTTDNKVVVTPLIYVAKVSNTAEEGYKEAVLNISANILSVTPNAVTNGASPQIDPSTGCWLVYDDALNAYVNTGVPASGYATDAEVQIAIDAAAAAGGEVNVLNGFVKGLLFHSDVDVPETYISTGNSGESAQLGVDLSGRPFIRHSVKFPALISNEELAKKSYVNTVDEKVASNKVLADTGIAEAKTVAAAVDTKVEALKGGSAKSIKQIEDIATNAKSSSDTAVLAANKAVADVIAIKGNSVSTLPIIDGAINSLGGSIAATQQTIGTNEGNNSNTHNALTARIAAEESRAKGKEQDVQTNIDAEKTRAQNAETGLSQSIETINAGKGKVKTSLANDQPEYIDIKVIGDGFISAQRVDDEGGGNSKLVISAKVKSTTPTQYDALVYDETLGKYINVNIGDLITSDQKVVRRYRVMDAAGAVDQSSAISLVSGATYLANLPNIYGLGLYVVKDDLTRKKLDPQNSNFYADGTPAILDGTQGMIQWCCNVDMYFKTYISVITGKALAADNGTWVYMELSHLPILGKTSVKIPSFGMFPGVWNKTQTRLDACYNTTENYRGGSDNAALDYDLVDSGTLDGEGNPIFNQVTGHATLRGKESTNKSIGAFATGAQKHGSLWNASWYVAHSALDILMMFILGTRNIQSTITGGTVISDTNFAKRSIPTIDGLYSGGLEGGNNNGADWAGHNGNNPVWDLSTGFKYGDVIGCLATDVQNWNNSGVKRRVYKSYFFGLPLNYDELWTLKNGMVCYHENITTEGGRSKMYVAKAMSLGLALPGVDPSTLAATWKYAHETVRTDGWIIRVAHTGLTMVTTKNGGVGSSNACEGDYCYSNGASSFGARVVVGDGLFGYGTNAGPFYSHLYNGVTAASTHYGVFLCHFKEDPQQYIIPWMDK